MSPLGGCMSYHMRVNDHIDHAKHCEIVIIMIMNGFVKSADEEAKNPDEWGLNTRDHDQNQKTQGVETVISEAIAKNWGEYITWYSVKFDQNEETQG